MNRKILLAAFAACFALLPTGFLLVDSVRAESNNNSETYRQLDLFGDVFERVRADYVEEVSDQQLIESAINGMLTALDPHSSYLDEKAFEDMTTNTKGEFGGLGIEVTMDSGFVKVVSPIDDTPAFRAGIKAGDFITHLDGEPVLGLTLAEAVEKMRGLVGTDIILTVRREGEEPFDLTITRDVIRIRSVRSRTFDDVGYIRVTTFNEQTDVGLTRAIKELKEDIGTDLKGFVIDLRNNPGGLLDQAIAVADTFLEKGEIVSTRGRDTDDAQRFNARSGDMSEGLPLVVLINGGSASASEIVAGALQDHRRAILIGTSSFGKGSVQTIIPLPGHGAMRLTTARYYTPSGRSIQAKGIDPDIEVVPAKIEPLTLPAHRRREADLRNALINDTGDEDKKDEEMQPDDGAKPSEEDAEGTGDEEGSAAEMSVEKLLLQDYQLARAIDLLRGIALFGSQMGEASAAD